MLSRRVDGWHQQEPSPVCWENTLGCPLYAIKLKIDIHYTALSTTWHVSVKLGNWKSERT